MSELDDAIDDLIAVARDDLERQARMVLEESNLNIGVGDPAEDPNPAVSLRESGRVEMEYAPITGRVLAYISYDTAYAVKQHESFHLRHPRGGGPRFLENAVTAHAARMAEEMGQALSAEIQAKTRAGRTHRRTLG